MDKKFISPARSNEPILRLLRCIIKPLWWSGSFTLVAVLCGVEAAGSILFCGILFFYRPGHPQFPFYPLLGDHY